MRAATDGWVQTRLVGIKTRHTEKWGVKQGRKREGEQRSTDTSRGTYRRRERKVAWKRGTRGRKKV